jgi:hypothetical protein
MIRRNDWLMKVDISDANLHVRIRLEDRKKSWILVEKQARQAQNTSIWDRVRRTTMDETRGCRHQTTALQRLRLIFYIDDIYVLAETRTDIKAFEDFEGAPGDSRCPADKNTIGHSSTTVSRHGDKGYQDRDQPSEGEDP